MNQKKCKYLVLEHTQNIVHELCKNLTMLKNNNCPDNGTVPCMGSRCNCAEYDNSMQEGD